MDHFLDDDGKDLRIAELEAQVVDLEAQVEHLERQITRLIGAPRLELPRPRSAEEREP